ncbi:glycosyltransferase family 4 protein [Tenacibaculum sp. SSH1-16]|uniref:glycosyltransferase family 4 protein n=1 Tax=Tenacibaculum sp. SSH1-16 TaxID=3136667 RepID=UPI0032C49EAA|nr:glycosyltransferase family 4 protein [Tenacibaculum mesophilum]
MNVGILLNTSWYIYNFRKKLIKKILEEGYNVVAIAPKDEYSKKLVDLGCDFEHVKMDSKSKNPIKDIKLSYEVYKILKRKKIDVLLNFTIKPNVYGSFASRFLNIKCINNVAGMGTLFSEGAISRYIFKALFKYSQKKVDCVFFQNPDDLEEFLSNKIIEKKKAKLLPGSGVNLEEFDYKPSKQNDKVVFLLVARMIYPKGVVELVEAGKKIRERGYVSFEIQLLGELGVNNPNAIEKSEFDKICSYDFVNYLGKTDNVRKVLEKGNVIVLPSYYREGTPKSLLEALAVGRPIITTNMPGCKETVVDGLNGYICHPRNINSLAEKMQKVLTLSYEDRLEMGKQSRMIAEKKFDERIVIDKYLKEIKR